MLRRRLASTWVTATSNFSQRVAQLALRVGMNNLEQPLLLLLVPRSVQLAQLRSL
jgi:hypothetical protein